MKKKKNRGFHHLLIIFLKKSSQKAKPKDLYPQLHIFYSGGKWLYLRHDLEEPFGVAVVQGSLQAWSIKGRLAQQRGFFTTVCDSVLPNCNPSGTLLFSQDYIKRK